MAWSPEKLNKARQTRKELTDINVRIAAMAGDFAELLARCDEIKEYSSFSCDTFYHTLDSVEVSAGSEEIHLFEWHVKERLDALKGQYDLKYWPPLSAVVQAIGDNARNAEVYARSPAIASAMESRRPGLSDFLKTFFARMKDNSVSAHGFIPNNFCVR